MKSSFAVATVAVIVACTPFRAPPDGDIFALDVFPVPPNCSDKVTLADPLCELFPLSPQCCPVTSEEPVPSTRRRLTCEDDPSFEDAYNYGCGSWSVAVNSLEMSCSEVLSEYQPILGRPYDEWQKNAVMTACSCTCAPPPSTTTADVQQHNQNPSCVDDLSFGVIHSPTGTNVDCHFLSQPLTLSCESAMALFPDALIFASCPFTCDTCEEPTEEPAEGFVSSSTLFTNFIDIDGRGGICRCPDDNHAGTRVGSYKFFDRNTPACHGGYITKFFDTEANERVGHLRVCSSHEVPDPPNIPSELTVPPTASEFSSDVVERKSLFTDREVLPESFSWSSLSTSFLYFGNLRSKSVLGINPFPTVELENAYLTFLRCERGETERRFANNEIHETLPCADFYSDLGDPDILLTQRSQRQPPTCGNCGPLGFASFLAIRATLNCHDDPRYDYICEGNGGQGASYLRTLGRSFNVLMAELLVCTKWDSGLAMTQQEADEFGVDGRFDAMYPYNYRVPGCVGSKVGAMIQYAMEFGLAAIEASSYSDPFTDYRGGAEMTLGDGEWKYQLTW